MEQVIEFRRALHKIPEASLKEINTKKFILEKLKTLNCKIEEIDETGIIAYFDNKKNTTIALRCDMDALPIKELNEIPYKSKTENYSHACGHDGHMAMILEMAFYLSENKVKNNVLLIFQPAEENIMGAQIILKHKVLEKYKVKHVFGMHIWPQLENNVIFTKAKELLAMACELDIEIFGKAAHIASYNEGIDTITIATQLLNDLFKMEKEMVSVSDKLLKFGKIKGGTIRNVLSDYTIVQGTIRTYHYDDFNYILENIKRISKEYEAKTGSIIKVSCTTPCFSVINDEILVNRFAEEKLVKLIEKPYLQGEDFGAYCHKVPSCFFLLGCGNNTKLHTPTFNFDESILITGVNLYKKLVEMEY